MKVAFITGITGQDGSYLAELLLDQDWIVYGLMRRVSVFTTQRIEHLWDHPHLKIRHGDMTDSAGLTHILSEIKVSDPETLHIYNLAAQSHVGVSFETPLYTAQVDAIGVLNLLEAVRAVGLANKARIYHASTSELYGKVVETPQTETTPFYPRSPYGVAKLYAFWITKNYRESYGMHISNGILFNHETVAAHMPLIFKQGNVVDIKPISEIVRYHTLQSGLSVDESVPRYQETVVNTDLEVWDNNAWTKVTYASGYPHDAQNNNKEPRFIIAKNAAYLVTGDHEVITADGSEEMARNVSIGDTVALISFPALKSEQSGHEEAKEVEFFRQNPGDSLECRFCNRVLSRNAHLKNHIEKCRTKNLFRLLPIDETEAELLGLLVGDGCFTNNITFSNTDPEKIDYVRNLWYQVCARNEKDGNYRTEVSISGFGSHVTQLSMTGFNDFVRKYVIYNDDKTKRVPVQVLNANKDVKLKFLEGYNMADGLKKNLCIYKFKNFKTNSAVLAQGLIFLIQTTTGQQFNVNVEENEERQALYYSINLLSDGRHSQTKSKEKAALVQYLDEQGFSQRRICRDTKISRHFIRQVLGGYIPPECHHYAVPANRVKKIIDCSTYSGWFYDLETQSGTFHAGIGLGRIHNSPRRGKTFVTRKITVAVGKIMRQRRDGEPVTPIRLGNLDAQRDWGHAKDYVKGMLAILERETPDDYVLATGEMHSVREFVEKAFTAVGITVEWRGTGTDEVGVDKDTDEILVRVDGQYFRPAEVDLLLGDATKAREILDWNPTITFEQLVKEMVEHDSQ